MTSNFGTGYGIFGWSLVVCLNDLSTAMLEDELVEEKECESACRDEFTLAEDLFPSFQIDRKAEPMKSTQRSHM